MPKYKVVKQCIKINTLQVDFFYAKQHHAKRHHILIRASRELANFSSQDASQNAALLMRVKMMRLNQISCVVPF